VLLDRSPLSKQPKPLEPLDLHFSGTSQAFVRSQDQTLHGNSVIAPHDTPKDAAGATTSYAKRLIHFFSRTCLRRPLRDNRSGARTLTRYAARLSRHQVATVGPQKNPASSPWGDKRSRCPFSILPVCPANPKPGFVQFVRPARPGLLVKGRNRARQSQYTVALSVRQGMPCTFFGEKFRGRRSAGPEEARNEPRVRPCGVAPKAGERRSGAGPSRPAQESAGSAV